MWFHFHSERFPTITLLTMSGPKPLVCEIPCYSPGAGMYALKLCDTSDIYKTMAEIVQSPNPTYPSITKYIMHMKL